MSLRFLDSSFEKSLNGCSTSATMDPQVHQNLSNFYQPLIGVQFQAMYNGNFNMPQTGNQRAILVITPQNPLAAQLQSVSSDVLGLNNGQMIWKGITTPEDRSDYVNYWLWVEPSDSLSSMVVSGTYDFKITSCTPFPCPAAAGSFAHGVSIQVTPV